MNRFGRKNLMDLLARQPTQMFGLLKMAMA
jgi:hypothetical protein